MDRPRREWRLVVTEPAPGAWNMAVDEALMESVRAGAAPALRFYRWSPPCLSLGRNQPATGAYDRDRLHALGVHLVRRPTGGRAVLHDAELTYAVIAADRELGTVRQAYHSINRALAAGLARLGAGVSIHPGVGATAPVPSTAPCFAEPVAGEVMAGGRKLVGSAQVRMNGVLLQHGSIHFRTTRLADALVATAGIETGLPAELQSVIGLTSEVDTRSVIDAIREAWTDAIGLAGPADLGAEELRCAARLTRRYEDDAWTWRR
jgi:lipoate-protein ligase A